MATYNNRQPKVDQFAIATSGEQKQRRMLKVDEKRVTGPRKKYDVRSASVDQGIEHLAADIVAGAIREFERSGDKATELYLRSNWCKLHCNLVGVNHQIVLDKIEGRI